jgi:hypothetical protein
VLDNNDQDGVISATKIDLHSLPSEILEVFSPLLCEMEEMGTTLTRDEFLDAALRLYSVRNKMISYIFIDIEYP